MQCRLLCVDLCTLQHNNVGHWCFIGDFNAVLGAHEKRGGNLPLQVSYDDLAIGRTYST